MRKSNLLKKVAAVVLSTAMAVTMVPFVGGTKEVKAEVVHTLTFPADMSLTKTKGLETEVGSDNYFTICNHSSEKINTSSATFSDGAVISSSLNTGGKLATTNPASGQTGAYAGKAIAGGIKITTTKAAIVKVWWKNSSTNADNCISVQKSQGTGLAEVSASTTTSTQNQLLISVLTIPSSGTYFIGDTVDKCDLYKIEVTEVDSLPTTTANPAIFAQNKLVGDKYSVRFVYEIDASDIATYTEVGVKVTDVATGKTGTIKGSDVYTSVMAGNVEVNSGSDIYYVVCELTDVPANSTFTVSTVKFNGETVTNGDVVYSYTTPNIQ